jgi:hypothetical protein
MRTKRIIASTLFVIIAILSSVNIAYAATGETDITIKSGPVKMSPITIGSFGQVTLTGLEQTAQTSVSDFTITDARGNAKGWKLQVSATPFTNGTYTLHDGVLTITGTQGTTVGKSDPFEQSWIAPSYKITSVPGDYISVPMLNGKGTFAFSGTKLNMELWPSEVMAGTYTGTITFDVVHNVD